MKNKLIVAAAVFAFINTSALAQPVDQKDIPTGFVAYHAPALSGQVAVRTAISASDSGRQVKASVQDMPTSFVAFHAPTLNQSDTAATAGIIKTASK
jgi:hypothetical protein